MTMWDVGGQDKVRWGGRVHQLRTPTPPPQIRRLWKHYFEGTDALIFVVDANDRDRIGEACEELHGLMKDEMLCNATLLVFANKMDLPDSMSTSEVGEKLQLGSLRNQNWCARRGAQLVARAPRRLPTAPVRRRYIQASSATSGAGLHEGLDWLAEKMKRVPKVAGRD